MSPTRRGPLRVAMVSALALPEMGGIETHVHEVSTGLAGAGVDVTVLTTDRSGELPIEEEFPGYHVEGGVPIPARGGLLPGSWIGTTLDVRALRRSPRARDSYIARPPRRLRQRGERGSHPS